MNSGIFLGINLLVVHTTFILKSFSLLNYSGVER